jgi:hypothetical protein
MWDPPQGALAAADAHQSLPQESVESIVWETRMSCRAAAAFAPQKAHPFACHSALAHLIPWMMRAKLVHYVPSARVKVEAM